MLSMLLKYALAAMLGILITLYFALKPLPEDIDPLKGFNEWEMAAIIGGSFLFGTLFFIILNRMKFSFIYGAIDIGASTAGMSITFFPLFSALGLNYLFSLFFSGIVASSVSFARDFRLKNATALLASAGIGALIGSSISYWLAIGLGAALIVYDYVAVRKTGHMIELAQTIAKHEMSMMVTSTEKIKGEESTISLGTGDIALPTAIACSFLQLSMPHSFIFILGCMSGIVVMFSRIEKGEFAPALPYLLIPGMAAAMIYQAILLAI
ncbi:MAG: presenilin family intramembrane aspartyl protease [Candidatus Anstonellales archaeon]